MPPEVPEPGDVQLPELDQSTIDVTITSDLIRALPRDRRGLPWGTVEFVPDPDDPEGELPGKIIINVAKLKKRLIEDQRSRLISSMGCASNVHGPGC